MTTATAAIVNHLKEHNQDHEWYPTTNEIIDAMGRRIASTHIGHGTYSLLDIGAGNGKVFKRLAEAHEIEPMAYAIEKSEILIGQLPPNVFVVGADFHEQTLIDKDVDIIFCNPPYLEFEEWAAKIIREAYAHDVYLVLPTRWKDSPAIQGELSRRKTVAHTVKSFDFLDSEDRRSRAKVDLIHLNIGSKSAWGRKGDPFETWFNDHFQFEEDAVNPVEGYKEEESHAQRVKREAQLVKGPSLIPRLVELYNGDMENLLNSYKALSSLDSSIIKELGVDIKNLIQALQMKIKGLKRIYWQELFSNFEPISSKLTTSSRKEMLGTLNSNTCIDFNEKNAYAVAIWVIKNANQYFDKQLVETYQVFIHPDNARNYVSNKRIHTDDWRAFRNTATHVQMEYRIVWNAWVAIVSPESYRDNINGLHIQAVNTLNDLCVIARNLGFNTLQWAEHFKWEPGAACLFEYEDGNTFMRVRAFKNGNLHIQFDQAFMRAFNIEAARILKWVRSAEEAAEEMKMDLEEVRKHFNKNIRVLASDLKLLAE